MSSSIRVLYTDEEIESRKPGGFNIAVRCKIPLVINAGLEDDFGFIPPHLDPTNSSHHSDPRVLLSETRLVVFDITLHPDCPNRRSVEAADRFLEEHLEELDLALRNYLNGNRG